MEYTIPIPGAFSMTVDVGTGRKHLARIKAPNGKVYHFKVAAGTFRPLFDQTSSGRAFKEKYPKTAARLREHIHNALWSVTPKEPDDLGDLGHGWRLKVARRPKRGWWRMRLVRKNPHGQSRIVLAWNPELGRFAETRNKQLAHPELLEAVIERLGEVS